MSDQTTRILDTILRSDILRRARCFCYVGTIYLGAIALTFPTYADQNAGCPEQTDTGFSDSLFDCGILWQIDNDDSRPSFLFGTMHVEDPKVTNLAPPVQEAFDQSRSLTTEALLDLEHILQIGPQLLLTDGSTLEDLIGTRLYGEVQKVLLSKGMMPEMAALLKPWAVALLLSRPPPRTGEFLDRKLYLQARESGKKVYGLETMEEQLEIFNEMTLAEQVTLLEETLAQANMTAQLIEDLTRAYLGRDLRELSRLAEEQFLKSPMQNQLKSRLLSDRNTRMVERMQDQLDEGNAFIAIGALHLPGAEGVLHLLRTKGYRISRLY